MLGPMKPFLLVLTTLLFAFVSVRADEPVQILLARGQTHTPDGFQVRITQIRDMYHVQSSGIPSEITNFSIAFPQNVGKAVSPGCQLMIQDTRGRTFFTASMEVFDNGVPHLEKFIMFGIKEKYRKGCELHFVYSDRQTGFIVKEYILFLPSYRPTKF